MKAAGREDGPPRPPPWRSVPPAHSPLPLRAIARGALAAAVPDPSEARVERLLRERWRPRALLLTDSGTSALRLALEGLIALRPGPVALPGYSCFDVATAAVGAGARPLVYDLDPETLSPEVDTVRAVLAAGATGLVVAHLYGVPVELGEVAEAVREAGAVLIEDAAQGAGAAYEGRPLGSFGSVSVLSFGRGKGITGGRGGALLAHDAVGEEILGVGRDRLESRRIGIGAWVEAASQWALGRPALYAIPRSLPWLGLGETRYRPPAPPAGLPRTAAGVLTVTLGLAEEEARIRRSHAARLLASLREESELRAVRPPASARPGWLRLPLLARDATRRAVARPAAPRLGIAPAYPAPLSSLAPLRERLAGSPPPLEGSGRLARELVTLPTHGRLTERDLQRLEAWSSDPS